MRLTKNCALVVVDIQEAFREVIFEFAEIASRTALAIEGFQILEVPIIITEQYPKGLGATASEILSVVNEKAGLIEKTTFSGYGEDAFIDLLEELDVDQIAICGLESHICVNQTVGDLIINGYQVHLLVDCITSRTQENKKIGIKKMTYRGAIYSSVEMALFEIMADSRHPKFKEIQKLIK